MAYAPSTVIEDGSIIGSFRDKETGNLYEYSHNNDDVNQDMQHKIWVTAEIEGIDAGFRYGKVLKTVAHVKQVDTQLPVKWKIKDMVVY